MIEWALFMNSIALAGLFFYHKQTVKRLEKLEIKIKEDKIWKRNN